MSNKPDAQITTPAVYIEYWNVPTLPFFIDLRGDSYADLSRSEAKRIYEFLGRALGGPQNFQKNEAKNGF